MPFMSCWFVLDSVRDADERDVHPLWSRHVFRDCRRVRFRNLPAVPGGQVFHWVWPVSPRPVLGVRGRCIFDSLGWDQCKLFGLSSGNILYRDCPQ